MVQIAISVYWRLQKIAVGRLVSMVRCCVEIADLTSWNTYLTALGCVIDQINVWSSWQGSSLIGHICIFVVYYVLQMLIVLLSNGFNRIFSSRDFTFDRDIVVKMRIPIMRSLTEWFRCISRSHSTWLLHLKLMIVLSGTFEHIDLSGLRVSLRWISLVSNIYIW